MTYPMQAPAPNLIRRLDLTSLQLFVAVCDHRNIVRAAAEAHLTASAVSKRLANTLQAFVMTTNTAILRRIEEVVTVFTGHLGLVHGLIGLAQQLISVHVVGLRVESDAKTG